LFLAASESRLVKDLMLLQSFAELECQIQSGKIRIRVLEQFDHAQTLPVMLEATVVAHALSQNFFAGMSERSVAEIVRQCDRFGEIFIERERAGDRPTDRRDFDGMRQPRPQMIPGAV